MARRRHGSGEPRISPAPAAHRCAARGTPARGRTAVPAGVLRRIRSRASAYTSAWYEPGSDPVRAKRSVLVQRVVVEAVGRRRPSRAIRSSRAAPVRVAGPVAVQVLADVRREVAGPLEPDRQRVRPVELGEFALRRSVAEHAVVVRVLAGQRGRARGAAEGEAYEAVLEARALRHQQAPTPVITRERLDRLVVRLDPGARSAWTVASPTPRCGSSAPARALRRLRRLGDRGPAGPTRAPSPHHRPRYLYLTRDQEFVKLAGVPCRRTPMSRGPGRSPRCRRPPSAARARTTALLGTRDPAAEGQLACPRSPTSITTGETWFPRSHPTRRTKSRLRSGLSLIRVTVIVPRALLYRPVPPVTDSS